jgi:hypothetical protein
MIWSTNHDRLANLTMWTLFFGGRDFAPQCIIDGINIQDWLHAHYLGAIDALAAAIASADSGNLLDRVVIGWDSLNEPAEGLIGRQNLSEVDHSEGKMHKGPTTSPLQEFNLGMGRRVNQAEYWVVGSLGPSQKGKVDLDPNGTKVWMEEEEDDALSKKWGYTRGSGWKKGLCSKSTTVASRPQARSTSKFQFGRSMAYGISTPPLSQSPTTSEQIRLVM